MISGWQQADDEPTDAYLLFALYRETPAEERSLVALAAKLGRDVSALAPPPDLAALAERHRWRERAALWDEAHKTPNDKRREMRERHARGALAFQQKVFERLKRMAAGELRPAELARWFRVAAAVEDRSRAADEHTALKDHAREFVQLALADPEACALADRLFARIAPRMAFAGGTGVVGQPKDVAAGPTSGTLESSAD
jgi:hypothetical protein